MTESNVVQLRRRETVEEHPIYHRWYLRGDSVTERRGSTPLIVRRHELCEFCSTERFTVINVRTWTVVRKPRYLYHRGETIRRINKATYLRTLFLQTTDLDEATKALLNDGKIRSK